MRPTRAWRLSPICSEDVRSFSSITSCSVQSTLAVCPACSAIADGFNGFAVHLEHHDVAMIAVSRAPIAALQDYKRRMGWTFRWASSLNSDFNYDFNTSFTEEQRALRQHQLQLQHPRHDTRLGGPTQVRGHDRHRRPHLHSRGAGHERVRTL